MAVEAGLVQRKLRKHSGCFLGFKITGAAKMVVAACQEPGWQRAQAVSPALRAGTQPGSSGHPAAKRCRGPWSPQPAGSGQYKHCRAVWSGMRALGTPLAFSTSPWQVVSIIGVEGSTVCCDSTSGSGGAAPAWAHPLWSLAPTGYPRGLR